MFGEDSEVILQLVQIQKPDPVHVEGIEDSLGMLHWVKCLARTCPESGIERPSRGSL